MINRQHYLETIKKLREDVDEIHRKCLARHSSINLIIKLIERQSFLNRLANELENYLRDN